MPFRSYTQKGRFGWTQLDGVAIPYLFRESGSASVSSMAKVMSARVLQEQVLWGYLSLVPRAAAALTSSSVQALQATEEEARLMCQINVGHCDSRFGSVRTGDDLVSLEDAEQSLQFLRLCHKKLVCKESALEDRCGFVRIDYVDKIVPYVRRRRTIESVGAQQVDFPLVYFDEDSFAGLPAKAAPLDDPWDVAYLRLCFLVHGPQIPLTRAEDGSPSPLSRVVPLEEVKGFFPVGTTFTDHWPREVHLENS